ncbi:MAG: hypothetical protein J6C09_02530 [Clostridia bacterium]|nr:hypothetical protein [Clostridia bacterium]
MSKSKIKGISVLITSVLLILLGILFIACTAHLYFTGGARPYSRERVGEYLSVLAIPSLITLLSCVVSFVFVLLFGEEKSEARADLTAPTLKRLSGRLSLEDCPEKIKGEILLERKKRKLALLFSAVFIAVFCIVMAVFLLNFKRFTLESYNADVIEAALIVLPLAVGIVGVICVKYYFDSESKKRELLLVREGLSAGAKAIGDTEAREECKCKALAFLSAHSDKVLLISRLTVIALALVLIGVGILNGGMADVLGKAVRICTECIGLG